MHVAVRSPLTGAVKFFMFDHEDISRAALFGYEFPRGIIMRMTENGSVTREDEMDI